MKKRYYLIDNLRALAIVQMVLYHGIWDLVYMYGVNISWFRTDAAFYWQQSICWTFILLSGFCWNLSKKPLKQGLTVSLCGILVTICTGIFSYNSRIVFGVLTLLGASALLLIPIHKFLDKIPAGIGAVLMFFSFAFVYSVNDGYFGFFRWNLLELPKTLYEGLFRTFLGFTEPGFFSTDYFSLLPWAFLYFTGYYLYQCVKKIEERYRKKGSSFDVLKVLNVKIPFFTVLGKHSLLIYLLHQPVLYAILWFVFQT